MASQRYKANSLHRSRETPIDSAPRNAAPAHWERGCSGRDTSSHASSRQQQDRNRPRDRDRSRSPYRAPRGSEPERPRDSHSHKRKASRSPSPYRRPRGEEHRNDDDESKDGRRHEKHADDRGASRKYNDVNRRSRISYADLANNDSNSSYEHTSQATSDRNGVDDTKKAANRSQTQSTDTREPEIEVAPPADEESEIEKRRRRREQLKARFGSQPQSALLQQVLVHNASESSTPNIVSPVDTPDKFTLSPTMSPMSPDVRSPDSQMQDSPGSPDVMVLDREEVAGGSDGISPTADSPSAAEYDPTRDMQEDQARAAQQTGRPDLFTGASNNNGPGQQEQLAPPKKKTKKEIDMFADDDEFEDNEDIQEETHKPTVLDVRLLDNWDDAEGYYKVHHNELVGPSNRYNIVQTLGKGVFANVVRASDMASVGNQGTVAIKIVRRNDLMKQAGFKEVGFLKRLNEADPENKRHLVQFLGNFEHKFHFCMVFEDMKMNLRDLLKTVSGGGFALKAVKSYAHQMFTGLKLLKDCQILHADLKPDNILVSHDDKTVKLCDLGTAIDIRDNNEPTQYLVSRFYRAPEVILGMERNYGIDMWAIGCTLFELWTGKILFTGNSNNQMIKSMMENLGFFTEKFLKKGDPNMVGQHFLFPPLKFASKEVDEFGQQRLRALDPWKKPPKDLRTRVFNAAKNIVKDRPMDSELNDFVDLLLACLNPNPDKRISPEHALDHKFCKKARLAPSNPNTKLGSSGGTFKPKSVKPLSARPTVVKPNPAKYGFSLKK
ncbi:kinase-like protein [Lindgomyces ingoldianus]|uniref:Kinase-like protein n=1 Tax=Lindgomyces ingoldianus TaxID=673940 RepID=A0ACB6R2L1_9PLEO|nr:kinase-like protein [Lindgomyces ingoldianus]KAF2473484.1 kinase-like protein [Lindgomyces ingoldianus]